MSLPAHLALNLSLTSTNILFNMGQTILSSAIVHLSFNFGRFIWYTDKVIRLTGYSEINLCP